MKLCLLIVGAAAVAAAGPAMAQPAPSPTGPANPQPGAAPSGMIVAASATLDTDMPDNAEPAKTETAPSAAPAKPRRAARVTSCRCGDSTPSGQ